MSEINWNITEIEKMRVASTSILDDTRINPDDRQSFQDPEENCKKMMSSTKKQNTVILKCKRCRIANLRKDLKVAYWVARTIESAKKKETFSLTNKLIYARGECVDLLEMYNNKIDMIADLYKRHESLNEKYENLANIIHVGFDKLRKAKVETINYSSPSVQLSKIIESKGYDADCCNECKSCVQTKQRNRFLKNKIIILENNIDAIKEQMRALEYRNMRLNSENNRHKAGTKLLDSKAYEFKLPKEKKEFVSVDTFESVQDSGDSSHKPVNDFGLPTHLTIVKRLLSDQDALLQELTMISKEIRR